MTDVVAIEPIDVFEPEMVDAMSAAVELICASLNLPSSALGARGMIARRVIELARGGERDAKRIGDLVLGETARQLNIVGTTGSGTRRCHRQTTTGPTPIEPQGL